MAMKMQLNEQRVLIEKKVEKSRLKQTHLHAERLAVQQAGVSKSEATARLVRWAEDTKAHAKRMVRVSILPSLTSPRTKSFQPFTDEGVTKGLVEACLCDFVVALVEEELERQYASAPGLSASRRRDRLNRIEEELLHESLMEEAMIRTAERAGIRIARSEYADPRALLAADECLPAVA